MGLEAEMQVPIVCVHVADMSDSWLVLWQQDTEKGVCSVQTLPFNVKVFYLSTKSGWELWGIKSGDFLDATFACQQSACRRSNQ